MTGNGREINHAPSCLLFPTLHLPRAASTTHLPCHPKQNRPLGISLAPKTQLRHQGKDRPVWQGCLAPNTDAGTLNGRGARDPQTQRPPRAAIPANSYLPIRPTSGNFLLESGRGFCPSSCCPVAFWAFLHSHPHLLLPYQITWASFINVELLDGGGWCPAGICEGVSFAQKWTIPGARLGTKQLSLAAALVCVSCLTKWKRDGGWSESYGERKPLLTLCIFNINVIKAVRQTSLPGWREAGRAPAKKLECVVGAGGKLVA